MPASPGPSAEVLRATMIRESPGHGNTASTRRQSQTVLSKIFNTSLLMFLDPNSFPYAHHGGVPALLNVRKLCTWKPCDSSKAFALVLLYRRLCPRRRSRLPNNDGPLGTS